MKIIPGPASKQLGEKIAELINAETVPIIFKTFPDGESYIRLEGEVQNQEVFIVQTTSPPQDAKIMQLAFIADAAKRNGAKKVTAIVPYLAYARQDKAFLQGEAISIEIIARMLKAAGIDSLITVNVHQEKVLKKFPFPAKNVSAIRLLAEYFRNKGYAGAFALAPDQGAMQIAEEAKKVLGGECGYLEKQRDRYTGQISVEKKTFDVRGKTAIIFDDIISTGGTIVAASKVLKELGAQKVFAVCVHPLLIGDAERRILEAGAEEIVGTDTVPSHVSKVSIAPLISGIIREHKSG
ncbi:MAG: ribose-phosphate diphosphokinase [Candidatus Bathyarchaeota archaeon]|nr:ribose-phosphate diphosphokinase [Candidatus Bathyarchaeota archaeon]